LERFRLVDSYFTPQMLRKFSNPEISDLDTMNQNVTYGVAKINICGYQNNSHFRYAWSAPRPEIV